MLMVADDIQRANRIAFGQRMFDSLALDRALGRHREQPEPGSCPMCDTMPDEAGFCHRCKESVL